MSSQYFDASSAATRKPFDGRVLLTHHDDLERVELGARMSELGWSVRFVASPAELVETALRATPSLVLVGLDYSADAVSRLRERGYRGLVVGLSGAPWPAGEREGRDCGCDDVVEATVPLLELKLKLRAWLEHRAVQANAAAPATPRVSGRWQQLWRRLLGQTRAGEGRLAA